MKFTTTLLLSMFGLQLCYSKKICYVPCNEYYTLKQSGDDLNLENKPRAKYSDSLDENSVDFGAKLNKVGDINGEDGITSDVVSGGANGDIRPLNGEGCGRMLSKCVRDSDCCTGYCQLMVGRCLFNPLHSQKKLICRPNKKKCLYNYQCCSGLCDPVTGLCLNQMVTLHPTNLSTTDMPCSPAKGTCQVNGHCCSQICDAMNGTCKASTAQLVESNVIDQPLINMEISSKPQQIIETKSEDVDEITKYERVVSKEISKVLPAIKGSPSVVNPQEVLKISTLEKKIVENLSLSSFKGLLEPISINKQINGLETSGGTGGNFETNYQPHQQKIEEPSLIQQIIKTGSSHHKENILGSTSSGDNNVNHSSLLQGQMETSTIQQENNPGSSTIKDIFPKSSSRETDTSEILTKENITVSPSISRTNDAETKILPTKQEKSAVNSQLKNIGTSSLTNTKTTTSPDVMLESKQNENQIRITTKKCTSNGQK